MTTPQFERARSAEAKHARETAILEAAARLAGRRGIRAVPLTDIAHTPLDLERGVSFAAVRSFKSIAIAEAGAVSAALCGILYLTEEQSGNVVATATAMVGALSEHGF